MSKKAVLRTAQDIFVLDKAFFLIEGHPSRTKTVVGRSDPPEVADLIWTSVAELSPGRRPDIL
jgi:hypothetical protein